MQAEVIALHVIHEIAAVGDIVLTYLAEIREDILTRDAEQRTQDIAVAGLDALHTTYARAPHEVEKQRLNAVVTMVSHKDTLSRERCAKTLEIIVAQLPCSHFNAYFMQSGVFGCVKVGYMKRNMVLMT